MAAKLIISVLFLGLANVNAQSVTKFMGRKVTVFEPKTTDAEGFFPAGPASVCLEGPPQKQCYTAPKNFGRGPNVKVVQLKKDLPALLFSAASGGVSGFRIHFALLRSGTGKNLEDLFMSDTEVSNQSQDEFWNEPAVSDSAIFITANYILGPNESHYGKHRYTISTYVRKPSSIVDGLFYYLEDRYMTVNAYDYEKDQILNSEKQEILSRLKRLKPQPH